MRVLVTRAKHDAATTARKLRSAGFEPVVWPLFELIDTGNPLPREDFDGVIFTSANAARVLLDRGWQATDPEMAAWCVGEKTAKLVSRLGFGNIVCAHGNAQSLAKLILETPTIARAKLLYPAAEERSFDIAKALEKKKITTALVEIYSVRKIHPSTEEVSTAVQQLNGGIVLAYSENTIRHIADVLNSATDKAITKDLTLLAISPKVAESVLQFPWASIYVSDSPNEQAMMEILRDLTLRKQDSAHI